MYFLDCPKEARLNRMAKESSGNFLIIIFLWQEIQSKYTGNKPSELGEIISNLYPYLFHGACPPPPVSLSYFPFIISRSEAESISTLFQSYSLPYFLIKFSIPFRISPVSPISIVQKYELTGSCFPLKVPSQPSSGDSV